MPNTKKYFLEIVQDRAGKYYANMLLNGERVDNLPEYVTYTALKNAILKATGIFILPKSEMLFYAQFNKRYAWLDTTQPRSDCRVTLQEINAGHTPCFPDGCGNYYKA